MCTPPFCWEGGIEPQTKFSKGGLDRISIFRVWVAGKEEVDLLQGGCSFYIKNKLKSEIFNEKKGL